MFESFYWEGIMVKRAGITWRDGCYLAEFLLDNGTRFAHDLMRHASGAIAGTIQKLYETEEYGNACN